MKRNQGCIEDCLYTNSEKYPDKIAIACGNRLITYSQLLRLVERRMNELTSSGFNRRDAYIAKSSQSADYLITYFAVHLLDGVMVPLESSTPEIVVENIKKTVNNSVIPNNVADILFTTGTTGKSKGVMISMDTIWANTENLIIGHEYSHENTLLIHGPLNHIASLSKVFPALFKGATIVILDGLKDISTFIRICCSGYRNIATFMVPANIHDMLSLERGVLDSIADKFDFIETGAAPISQYDMERLCEVFPHTRMYNTYASTETGIIATHNFNSNLCIAGCVGHSLKNSSFEITEKGNVACCGKTIMLGYVNDPELTNSVLVDGKIISADRGYIDNDGMLHLLGRSDDVINIGGFNVSPVEVEDCTIQIPGVKDCICVGVKFPQTDMTILKLIVVLENDTILNKKDIAEHLASRLEKYKIPKIYEFTNKIVRMYNGKLNRKYYQ